MVRRAFLICLVLCAAASTALGGGFAVSGIGAKAAGLGSAFRGLADDWSAAYWNPAGLAQLEQSEFSFMAVTVSPRPQYKPEYRFGEYEVGFKNGEFRYPSDKTDFLPNGSGYYKLTDREDITFGVAVFVPYSLNAGWDLFEPVYSDANAPYPGLDHEARLKVVDIHPSVAKSFMENKLMLGAGLSLLNGDFEYRNALLRPTPFPRPHEYVAVDADLKADGWGYGANFGLLYKATEKVQVGISGRTPTTLKLDGDMKKNLYAFSNFWLWLTALDEAATASDTAMIDYLDRPTGIGTWQNDASTELKLPGDVGVGFALFPSEKLTLAVDLSYTLWSALDAITIELDNTTGNPPPVMDPSDTLMVITTKYDDALGVSLGGQYQVSEPLALRLGFFYDQAAMPDKTFNPLFMDMGARYGGSLGAGVAINNWQLSYNLQYMLQPEREVANSAAVGSDFDNYPGTFKSYTVGNSFSVTYRF